MASVNSVVTFRARDRARRIVPKPSRFMFLGAPDPQGFIAVRSIIREARSQIESVLTPGRNARASDISSDIALAESENGREGIEADARIRKRQMAGVVSFTGKNPVFTGVS